MDSQTASTIPTTTTTIPTTTDTTPTTTPTPTATAPFDKQRQEALERRDMLAKLRAAVEQARRVEEQKVPGLVYVADFLTAKEEAALLQHVDRSPWETSLKRRVQQYGWTYRYKERSVQASDYLGPLPAWMGGVLARLRQSGLASTEFDQCIVNEYMPGQGIAAHVDRPHLFDDEIVTVSLGSAVQMDFEPARKGSAATATATKTSGPEPAASSVSLRLAARSAALLSGEARYAWTHGIAARLSDPNPATGERKRRRRRVSLTFRRVKSVARPADD
eukprot:m.213810 g.213810  ORF g.213810 m.213810 type:complete len:276 (+) comp29763_c0_seq1:124-951(+)